MDTIWDSDLQKEKFSYVYNFWLFSWIANDQKNQRNVATDSPAFIKTGVWLVLWTLRWPVVSIQIYTTL